MKHVKIVAGLAHVNYRRIAGLIKEVSDTGIDYIHSDVADIHDLQSMKLMGGHQIIAGICPEIDKPVECHVYTVSMDRMLVRQTDEAGADILTIPAEHFIDAQLAYTINWCHERHIRVGPTLGCCTPLCFVKESIYDIDRLHIITHGVGGTDGKDNWGWRKSATDLVQRTRKMIDEENPKCELVVGGGFRADNMGKLTECNPDVIILSSAIFKDPDGVAAGVEKCRAAIDAIVEKYGLE